MGACLLAQGFLASLALELTLRRKQLAVVLDHVGIVMLPRMKVGVKKEQVRPQEPPSIPRTDQSEVEHAERRRRTKEDSSAPETRYGPARGAQKRSTSMRQSSNAQANKKAW